MRAHGVAWPVSGWESPRGVPHSRGAAAAAAPTHGIEHAKLLNDWRYGSAVEKTTEGQVRRSALVQMLDSGDLDEADRIATGHWKLSTFYATMWKVEQ